MVLVFFFFGVLFITITFFSIGVVFVIIVLLFLKFMFSLLFLSNLCRMLVGFSLFLMVGVVLFFSSVVLLLMERLDRWESCWIEVVSGWVGRLMVMGVVWLNVVVMESMVVVRG